MPHRAEAILPHRANIAPETTRDIGGVAAERQLQVVPNTLVGPELSVFQIELIDLLSQGHTNWQTAKQMGVHVRDIHRGTRRLMEKYRTKDMAIVVSQSIEQGHLPIKISPDEEVIGKLTEFDKKALKFYARGGKESQIAKAGGIPMEKVQDHSVELFTKLGAWDNLHAIRRGYELGILKPSKVEPRRTV